MESLSRPSAPLSDLFSPIPLVLEVGRLGIPFVDLVGNGVEGHDPLHERGGDSGGEETDEHVVVRDAGAGGVTLERRDVALERRGVFPVLLGHAMGREPGDGVPGCVLVFERRLELFEKVVPCSEGNSGAVDGVLPEGVGPGQSRPLGHVREREGNPLRVVVVRFLVDR